jgi:hypothetical protein
MLSVGHICPSLLLSDLLETQPAWKVSKLFCSGQINNLSWLEFLRVWLVTRLHSIDAISSTTVHTAAR